MPFPADLNDPEAVSKVVNDLEQYYANARASLEETRKWYNLEHRLAYLPENIETHVPSTAAGLIDHAADHIPVDTLIPRVEPLNNTKKSSQQAIRLTQLHKFFIQGIVESSIDNPLRQMVIDLFLGATCLKVLLADEW